MNAQLDPGFTTEGFWANAAVQVFAAFVGTLGAFVVAWLIYRRTSEQDRATFEETLTHERKLLQDQFAHDLLVRREEDEKRRVERDEAALQRRRQLLLSLLSEFELNIVAVNLMTREPARLFALRRNVLDQSFVWFQTLPSDVVAAIQTASMAIDRYNASEGTPFGHRGAILQEALGPLETVNDELKNALDESKPAGHS
jgi:hypothetical protein